MVFVAASAEEVVREAALSFEEKEGVRVLVHASGSTRLRTQILRGAPADLYVAAGPIDLPGRVEVVAVNRMVAVVPVNSGEGDWRQAKKIALADPDLAPAGVYARRILEREGYQGEWIYGGHVRAVLAYVELGLVDVGFVYRSDVSDRVRVVASFSDLVEYEAMSLSDRESARLFLSFLIENRNLFREKGFE
ncbi:MAG: molybdate ABC transporter substrate-binding protein [Planctomycetota bacterium]|nr:molybdate ABC transporter substrate-binding protein [Planctomycetota bacterium]